MEDPSAIPVLEAVMEAVEHANPSWTGLLPNAINIIDDALAAKMGTTASVLRLDRYLTHVIQKKLSVVIPDLTLRGTGHCRGQTSIQYANPHNRVI